MSQPVLSEEKLCSSCGLKIPVPAKLCHICGSYQNWRRFVSMSTTTLALLTALVSVSTGLLAALESSTWLADSSVSGRFVHKDYSLVLFLANAGNRPARISSVHLQLPDAFPDLHDPVVKKRLPIELADRNVPADSSRQEELTMDENYRGLTDEPIKKKLPGAVDAVCQIRAEIFNFRGSTTEIVTSEECARVLVSLSRT